MSAHLTVVPAALRPPCPTCDGTQEVMADASDEYGSVGIGHFIPAPCPDCVDGKVSVEQLVATYNAVWDDHNDVVIPADCCGGPDWRGHYCQYHAGVLNGWELSLDYLRSVKP